MGMHKGSARTKSKSLVKASARQKQSVEVHVHVDSKSERKHHSKKRKHRKKNAESAAESERTRVIVRPIYQSILPPQPMPPHHSWPPNVSETNSQVQRQNLQNELQHEQTILSLQYPKHAKHAKHPASHSAIVLGLNSRSTASISYSSIK